MAAIHERMNEYTMKHIVKWLSLLTSSRSTRKLNW
jgi:hypothetical protein